MRVPTVIGISENKNELSTQGPIKAWWCSYWQPILAEFISTAILIQMGCMTTIPFEGQNSAIYAPLGFGLVVLFNIQIFGHISGAHMNSSVTLASVIWGKMSIISGIAYFLAQCVGALAGYGLLSVITPIDVVSGGICVTKPLAGMSALQTVGIEMGLTAVISFLCCAMWDPVNEDKQECVSIKFALTVAGLSMVGGPWTGASMNPPRSLAPAIFTGIWTMHWAYWVGPLAGSSLAVVIYKYIFLNKK